MVAGIVVAVIVGGATLTGVLVLRELGRFIDDVKGSD